MRMHAVLCLHNNIAVIAIHRLCGAAQYGCLAALISKHNT